MLINYLKIFFCLFSRQRGYSAINVLGLAVGMASCLIIALFVRNELNFDRFFTDADQLYRVSLVVVDPGGEVVEGGALFYRFTPLLEQNFPEFEAITRMTRFPTIVSANGNSWLEEEFRQVDPNFFSVFDFEFIEGDAGSAFMGPADVVLTSTLARKYFGNTGAVGQTLDIDEGVSLRVTGVIEDLPGNTHLEGSAFLSMALMDVLGSEPNPGESYYTYVKLKRDADVEALNMRLVDFSEANIPSVTMSFRLTLEKVSDIHLNPTLVEMKPGGSKLGLLIFSAIGLAILLVAVFNFVNLTTARSSYRNKEVGLRLALGARRSELITQFMGESLLFIFLAMVAATALVEVLLPMLGSYLGPDFEAPSLFHPFSLLAMFSAAIVLSFVAGWYPAIVMAGSKPANVVNKTQNNAAQSEAKGPALKNILVILQFSIAIAMIISALTIYSQMQYTRGLDQGFYSDQVLVIRTNNLGSRSRALLLKEQLLQHQGIAAVTVSSSTPEESRGNGFLSTPEAGVHMLAARDVDHDYFSVFDIELLAGRLFLEERSSDRTRVGTDNVRGISGSFILNERGAREFGWTPEEAVGQILELSGNRYAVVGVVSDTIESALEGVRPSVYKLPSDTESGTFISIRLEGGSIPDTLAYVDELWHRINPEEPLISSFLDENIAALYESEAKQSDLFRRAS